MNAVQLIGRLTHDPEADETADGRSVATIRVAVDRPGGDGADFVTVKVWGRLAGAVTQYLTRGRQVAVQGRLHHDEWTGPDGDHRSRLLVVARRVEFLDSSALSPRSHFQHEDDEATPFAFPDRASRPADRWLSTVVEKGFTGAADWSTLPDEM